MISFFSSNVHILLSVWFLTFSETCSDLQVWIKASCSTVKMIVTFTVCFAFLNLSWVALWLVWGIQVCVALTTPCFNLFCRLASPRFEVFSSFQDHRPFFSLDDPNFACKSLEKTKQNKKNQHFYTQLTPCSPNFNCQCLNFGGFENSFLANRTLNVLGKFSSPDPVFGGKKKKRKENGVAHTLQSKFE